MERSQDPLAPELAEAAAETAQCLGTDASLGKDMIPITWIGGIGGGREKSPERWGYRMWQIIMTSSRVNPPNGGLGDSVNPLNKMPRKNSNVEELFSEICLPGSVFFSPPKGWGGFIIDDVWKLEDPMD